MAEPISSGQRTELVSFERFTSESDGAGGQIETWRQIGRAWVAAKILSGDEKAGKNGPVRTNEKVKFTGIAAAFHELRLTTRDDIVAMSTSGLDL